MPAEPAARLTRAQVWRWHGAQADGWRTSHMSPVYWVSPEVDPGLLARALSDVVRRHAPLRTRIVPGPDGSPTATSRAVPEPYPLEVIDLTGLPDETRAAAHSRIAARELATPIDLAADRPLRAVLVLTGPEGHALFLTLSHLVADGWSCGVLVRDLQASYRMLARDVPLQEPPWDEVWDAYVEESDERDRAGRGLGWWRSYLGGGSCRLDLGPETRDTTALTIPFELPEPVSEDLRRVAAALHTSTTCVSLAAFAVTLAHYARTPDLLVTVPYAGREAPEHEPLVGLFTNRLLVRLRFDSAMAFEELVAQAQEALLDVLDHAGTPFRLIEEAVFPDDTASTTQAAIQVIPRTLCDAPGTEPDDISFYLRDFPTAATNFQFSFDLVEPEEGPFNGWMTCQAAVVPPDRAKDLLAHFTSTLSELTRAPSGRPIRGSTREPTQPRRDGAVA